MLRAEIISGSSRCSQNTADCYFDIEIYKKKTQKNNYCVYSYIYIYIDRYRQREREIEIDRCIERKRESAISCKLRLSRDPRGALKILLTCSSTLKYSKRKPRNTTIVCICIYIYIYLCIYIYIYILCDMLQAELSRDPRGACASFTSTLRNGYENIM